LKVRHSQQGCEGASRFTGPKPLGKYFSFYELQFVVNARKFCFNLTMPQTAAEKENVKDFGAEVQKFREDRRLSPEEFAGRMGISARQFQKIEKGLPRTSILSWLRFLVLLKPETQESFYQRSVPMAQKKFGIKPLRRETRHFRQGALSLRVPCHPLCWWMVAY
jgi:DNA-binding XRE family transcriptional regulator